MSPVLAARWRRMGTRLLALRRRTGPAADPRGLRASGDYVRAIEVQPGDDWPLSGLNPQRIDGLPELGDHPGLPAVVVQRLFWRLLTLRDAQTELESPRLGDGQTLPSPF